MITVRLKSNTGSWEAYELPVTHDQLAKARAAWRVDQRDAFNRQHKSRDRARQFLDDQGVPKLNGFDELIITTAVMAGRASFRWER